MIDLFIVGKFLGGFVISTAASVVGNKLSDSLKKKNIIKQANKIALSVTAEFSSLLEEEGISDEQQEILLNSIKNELQVMLIKPSDFFKNSLVPVKIYDDYYQGRNLPQEILDNGLKYTFPTVFKLVIKLIIESKDALEQWENENFRENFKRFDILTERMRESIEAGKRIESTTLEIKDKVDDLHKITTDSKGKVDELHAIKTQKISEEEKFENELFNKILRQLRLDSQMKMDITGLRADKPFTCNFDDIFVEPEIIDLEKRDYFVMLNLFFSLASGNKSVLWLHPKMLIIGSAGSGKSTCTQYIQREFLKNDNTPKLTVTFNLRELKEKDLPSAFEIFCSRLEKNIREDFNKSYFSKWIKENKIALIFDGFDEINNKNRDKIIKQLNGIIEYFSEKSCIIVTSRPLSNKSLKEELGFSREETKYCYTLKPFDKKRIIEYIEKWNRLQHSFIDDKEKQNSAKELAKQWMADPTIEPLTRNPLMLSTLMMVHHLDGKLPNGRSNLYERYVNGMLGIWDDRRKIEVTNIKLKNEIKFKILAYLAINFFFEDTERLEEAEIHTFLGDILENLGISYFAEDVLNYLCERTGLLIGPGSYEFAHKTLYEYLIAYTIEQANFTIPSKYKVERLDRHYLFKNRYNDSWNSVLFFWLGLTTEGQLEEFLKDCWQEKTIEAYKLSLGIIYDQKDRIDKNLAKEVILDVISLKELIQTKNEKKLPFRDFATTPKPYIEIDYFHMYIKSMYVLNIDIIFRLFFYNYGLSLKTIESHNEVFDFFIISYYIINVKSFDELKQKIGEVKNFGFRLIDKDKSVEYQENIEVFLFETVFRSYFNEGVEKKVGLVDFYLREFPKLKNKILVSIILSWNRKFQIGGLICTKFSIYLAKESYFKKIDSNFLPETFNYKTDEIEEPSSNDILKETLKDIKSTPKDNRPKDIEYLIESIEELIARRDKHLS